eukprot:TRINITY_DN17210_c0_g1_i1.p1 TRINITY_DN17210_c0_g1~~TRINITY_DN17210_c0_g1_i1.p1  ORF type:complete len:216 (-),score=30.14 TRINITY_DN17210_c0_g1_i1:121-768(-)
MDAVQPQVSLPPEIERISVSREQLRRQLQLIGYAVSNYYRTRLRGNERLVVICVLKGAFMFCSDLLRELSIPVQVEFMAFSSYRGESTTADRLQLVMDLRSDIRNRHVLVVEDVVDSGQTVEYIKFTLNTRQPASLRVCALAAKEEDIKTRDNPDGANTSAADFVGFHLPPDEFIVGYGMDYDERFRELPYIGILKESVYEDTDRRSRVRQPGFW